MTDQQPNPNPVPVNPTPGTSQDAVPYFRFQEVNEQKNNALKELDQVKKELATVTKEKEEAVKGVEEAKTKFEAGVKKNAILAEALKNGAKDAETVAKLIDIDAVEVSEDGTVKAESVTKQITDLKTKSAYLFGQNTPNSVGASGGANEGGSGYTGPRFKRSELQNAKFYRDNEKAIIEASQNGAIEDDVSNS